MQPKAATDGNDAQENLSPLFPNQTVGGSIRRSKRASLVLLVMFTVAICQSSTSNPGPGRGLVIAAVGSMMHLRDLVVTA